MTGTMCLTEPQCGSDLGQVSTKAVPVAGSPGEYRISGTKIFISCGEHDMTENIVHCVLARLPDAPAGTAGISLFLVPKRHLAGPKVSPRRLGAAPQRMGARPARAFLRGAACARAPGLASRLGVHEPRACSPQAGELNSLGTSRIEDKMGCHGSPTCQLEFDGATGWLIGTPNRGLNHMFTFINTSRLGTAVQGVAAAEIAFQNSLWYCKERRSMRALSGTKEPDQSADAIIHHPSVRTMLLTQKAVAEGAGGCRWERRARHVLDRGWQPLRRPPSQRPPSTRLTRRVSPSQRSSLDALPVPRRRQRHSPRPKNETVLGKGHSPKNETRPHTHVPTQVAAR